MTTSAADVDAGARQVIEQLARGYRRENIDGYLAVFDPHAVWVISRGVCFRGRVALGDYLRQVIRVVAERDGSWRVVAGQDTVRQ